MEFKRDNLYDLFCYYCNDDKFFKKINKEIQKRDSVIQRLEENIINLQGELNTAKSDAHNLQRELNTTKSDGHKLQGELNTAKSDLHKLQGERSKEKETYQKATVDELKKIVASNENISEVLEKQPNMSVLCQKFDDIKDLLQSPLPKREVFDVELERRHKGVGQINFSLEGTYHNYDDNQMSSLKLIETIRKKDDDDTMQSFSVDELRQILKFWGHPIIKERNKQKVELQNAVKESMKKTRHIFLDNSNENGTDQPTSTRIYYYYGTNKVKKNKNHDVLSVSIVQKK